MFSELLTLSQKIEIIFFCVIYEWHCVHLDKIYQFAFEIDFIDFTLKLNL
jgi:hypothetical protein